MVHYNRAIKKPPLYVIPSNVFISVSVNCLTKGCFMLTGITTMPQSAMLKSGPGLYEFLIEAELQQYYSTIKNDLKVCNRTLVIPNNCSLF